MIILVAGVYGVGKTTLCGMLARELGCTAASASTLIRQRRGKTTWSKNKNTDEIAKNQQYLIESLDELRAHNQSIILDGHFALLDSNGIVTKIQRSVFDALNIDAIVLIECDVDEIALRLSARDSRSWTYSTIAALMAAERENAIDFHKVSGVPLKIFDFNAPQEVLDYITAFKDVSNDPRIKEH